MKPGVYYSRKLFFQEFPTIHNSCAYFKQLKSCLRDLTNEENRALYEAVRLALPSGYNLEEILSWIYSGLGARFRHEVAHVGGRCIAVSTFSCRCAFEEVCSYVVSYAGFEKRCRCTNIELTSCTSIQESYRFKLFCYLLNIYLLFRHTDQSFDSNYLSKISKPGFGWFEQKSDIYSVRQKLKAWLWQRGLSCIVKLTNSTKKI